MKTLRWLWLHIRQWWIEKNDPLPYRSRFTDPTPVECKECGHMFLYRDAVHGYTCYSDFDCDDCEACDECPQCGKEIEV